MLIFLSIMYDMAINAGAAQPLKYWGARFQGGAMSHPRGAMDPPRGAKIGIVQS